LELAWRKTADRLLMKAGSGGKALRHDLSFSPGLFIAAIAPALRAPSEFHYGPKKDPFTTDFRA
jgi:hypothetical protein